MERSFVSLREWLPATGCHHWPNAKTCGFKPLITWDPHETDSLIGIQQRSENGDLLWSGAGEGALAALEGHPWLKTEIQFPVGNSCKWAAPFVERGTKNCMGMRLIYLPHNIECSIRFGSRLIHQISLETWLLQASKNVNSISSLGTAAWSAPLVGMWRQGARCLASDVSICWLVLWTQTLPMMLAVHIASFV